MKTARLRGRFPCSADGARRARKLVVEFATNWLGADEVHSMELACGEALANCVEHGGGRSVEVDCWCNGDSLVAEIRHNGRQFTVPPTIAPPPQGALRGYGLFIMHQTLDSVEFLDGGTGLRLVKNLRD